MGRTITTPFDSIGRRSGVFSHGDLNDPMNQALERMAAARRKDTVPRMLNGTSPDSVAELVSRRDLGRQGIAIIVEGPRYDLSGGWGPRFRVGLLGDGVTYGDERWDAQGNRQVGMFV